MMVSGIVFLGVSAIVALATVVFLKAVSLTRVVARRNPALPFIVSLPAYCWILEELT